MTKRRSPIHHRVRDHKREGKEIQSYLRGKGKKGSYKVRVLQSSRNSTIRTQRSALKETLKVISPFELKFVIGGFRLSSEDRGKTLATYNLKTKIVTLYRGVVTRRDQEVHFSIYHEIGHAIWHSASIVLCREEVEGMRYLWLEVYKKEQVSQRAKKNEREGFAEAYANYRLAPETVKDFYLKTYVYMRGMFG